MKLLEVADGVTLEEVNAITASVLSYISHYGKEAALLEEVGPDPVSKGYAQPGPSRMTSIVACVPAFMDASGQSTGRLQTIVDQPLLLRYAVADGNDADGNDADGNDADGNAHSAPHVLVECLHG